ncbi:MAG TPA: sigma-54 dependent transcriptional regulator, partial [Longimicrobiales bacterium]
FDRFLGASAEADAVREFGRRAAAVDAPVLLAGESGTGKGLLARAIHEASARNRRSFVAVNCAGVPETLFESHFFGHDRGAFTGAQQSHRGLFEQADGGTLFLDEVSELPLSLQAKLLTALEDGEIRRLGSERVVRVSPRLIAAAGCDLLEAVRRRAFRRDLYHRLVVLSCTLPPLRDRPGDVEALAACFLQAAARRYALAPRPFDHAALERLRLHPWPGNVRELAHAVEAALLACDGPRILLRHLPPGVRDGAASGAPLAWGVAGAGSIVAGSPPDAAGAAYEGRVDTRNGGDPAALTRARGVRYSFFGNPHEERRRIAAALEACRGNKTRAAEMLGMARNTLRAKLREAASPEEAAGGVEVGG